MSDFAKLRAEYAAEGETLGCDYCGEPAVRFAHEAYPDGSAQRVVTCERCGEEADAVAARLAREAAEEARGDYLNDLWKDERCHG